MKIAIINQHPSDFLGGSEIQCDIIATYLARFGHQVTYLAVDGAKATYDTPYRVVPVGNLKPFRLLHVLRRQRPDVVYWRLGKEHLLTSAIVARLVAAKFVYSMSSPYDSRVWASSGQTIFAKQGWHRGVGLRAVLRDVANCSPVRSALGFIAIPLFVDAVVSLNADHLARVPVKNKTTIHNSVIVEETEFSWPRPYVAWVANLKRIKNPDKYYQLAAALQDTGVDFLMVGGIQDRTYDYLTKAGEGCPDFHYLGPRSPAEVNGILRNALFLVHTCGPEGFGSVFIQAWLQAKPTISLYFDPEGIIETEGIGYLSGSFPCLVEQTRHLIDDESSRIRMGRRARAYAEQHFDSNANVRRLETFLFDVLGNHGSPQEAGA